MWSLPTWINPHLISIALHSLHPAPQPSFELSYLHVPLSQDLCPPTWNSLFTLPSWHLFWFMRQILIVSSPAPQKYLLNDVGVWRGDSQVRLPFSLPGIRASWERRDGENNQMEIKISVLRSIGLFENEAYVCSDTGMPSTQPGIRQAQSPSLCCTGKLHTRTHRTNPSHNSPPRGRTEYVFKKGEEKGVSLCPPTTVKNLPLTRQPGNPLHLHRTEQEVQRGQRYWENPSM